MSEQASTSAAAEAKDEISPPKSPKATSIIVIGMAGSGKSTFTACLEQYQKDNSIPSYFVNLDPAVSQTNYTANVDIRDTIDYKRLMDEYNLGPNGGILTALNLFTTKFDQVLNILEKRASSVENVVLDTPGQIEIFTWSASGAIITDALATSMPTCIAYIIDTPRTLAPATFMSNMLYACSIMYKTKLPFIVVFNKIDVQDHQFALSWMEDFEEFQKALRTTRNATDAVGSSGGEQEADSYMNSLMNSMALVLDEFYRNLRTVGVSSTTQKGMEDFFAAVQEARKEYVDDYQPELERVVAERKLKREQEKKEQLDKMMRDMRLKKDIEREESPDFEPAYEGDGEILDPDSEEDAAFDDEEPAPSRSRGARQFHNDGTAWPRSFNM